MQGNLVVSQTAAVRGRALLLSYGLLLIPIEELFNRRLPRTVGYSDANSLIITDALDETFTLPLSIVATYEVVDIHVSLSMVSYRDRPYSGLTSHLAHPFPRKGG